LVDGFFSNRPRAVDSFEKRPKGTIMTSGTIKKLISERGFGFITAEDGKDYFFHKDGLSSSLDFDRLVGGESVTFEVEAGPKGPRAVQVQSA
jgi:CspA family cold shock protein